MCRRGCTNILLVFVIIGLVISVKAFNIDATFAEGLPSRHVVGSESTPIYNTPFLTDEQLENYNSMNAEQVRTFLASYNSYFRQPIQDVDGQFFDPPVVIEEAAQHYRINPQVILATLQKESSGVTRRTRPSNMGFLMGCAGPAHVLPVPRGTARWQLWCAAERFRSYHDQLTRNGVTVSGWRVGVPKVTQDGVTVIPATRAVAGQFTYTPYAGVQWGGNRPDVGGVYLFYDAWTRFGFGNAPSPSTPAPTPTSPPQPTPTLPPPTQGVTVLEAWPAGDTFSPGQTFNPKVKVRTEGFRLDCSKDFLENRDGNLYGTHPTQGCRDLGSNIYEFAFGIPMHAPGGAGDYHSKWQIWQWPNHIGPVIDLWFHVGAPTPTPIPTGVWQVEYFRDKNLGSRCATRTDSSTYLFYMWEDDAPADGCPRDQFSARFTRRFYFPAGDYRFHCQSDDGCRIFIDGRNIADSWHDSSFGGNDGYPAISPGEHEVRVEYYENTGGAKLETWWSGPGFLPWSESDRDPSRWWAEYYGNRKLEGEPVLRRNEGAGFLEKDWGDGGIGYGMPGDHFSARFRRVVPFVCGRYRFTMYGDDGLYVRVGDQVVLNSWRDQAASFTRDVDISEGSHEVLVQYYENGGKAKVSVRWELLTPCPTPTPTPVPPTPTFTPTPVPPTPTPTPTPVGVSLHLIPVSPRVTVGEEFTLTVRVEAWNQQVDGAEVYVTFDPNYVEAKAFLAGGDLPTVIWKNIDNTNGLASLAVGKLGAPFPKGTFDVGYLRLRAKAVVTTTALAFASGTQVSSGGQNLLSATYGARVAIVSAQPWRGQVALQGHGPAGSSRWAQYPLTLRVFAAGASTPLRTETLTLDANGVFTASVLSGGVYDLEVEGPHSLCNRRERVQFPFNGVVNMGLLREGDANDDEKVDILDFSLLASVFGTRSGDGRYKWQVDFNDDGKVDILDFSLLATNFGMRGCVRVNRNLLQNPKNTRFFARARMNVEEEENAPKSEKIVLRIWLEDVTDGVDAAKIVLRYDPRVLELETKAKPGKKLGVKLEERIDPIDGRLELAVGRVLGENAPNGKIDIASIVFRRRGKGNVRFRLEAMEAVYQGKRVLVTGVPIEVDMGTTPIKVQRSAQ